MANVEGGRQKGNGDRKEGMNMGRKGRIEVEE